MYWLFIVGFLLGVVVTTLAFSKYVGSIMIVDPTEPDEPPYVFLSLSTQLENVARRKRVILRVDDSRFTSRK